MALNTCPRAARSPLEAKERQLVWLLARQLGEAQVTPGSPARVARLWQEVHALEIDPERIVALLYGGHDLSDRAVLEALDPGPSGGAAGRPAWRPPGAPALMRLLHRGGGRRSAPPAAPRAHPAGR